jgi:predicted ATPase
VVIEEPENSVHPWIVRAIVDTCREAEQKQIVLTTHSPALLSYLLPEEVTVVWRTRGQSKVAPLTELDPMAAELWRTGQADVFGILDGGYIRETVPPGYS